MNAWSAEARPSLSVVAPYEEFFNPGSPEPILSDGWKLGRKDPVRLAPPIDWSYTGDAERSWNYHLHALDLIDAVLLGHSKGGDRALLEAAFAVGLDWVDNHPDPETPDRSPMAWYDMAVGLRAYRLGYLWQAAEAEDVGSAEARVRLEASLVRHLELLGRDDFFTAHTNHGFYQLCGQLALARRLAGRPEAEAAREQGQARLKAMLDVQFAADGTHKEHSTDYHRSVAGALGALVSAGLADVEAAERVARAREALDWFVKPNGRLTNFGDSDNKPFEATVRPEGFRAFHEGGWFVARRGAGRKSSFLAQILSFHSRTHKHADDLSFVWSEGGRDILVDAGRLGYLQKTKPGDKLWKEGFWYGDPRRVFVESTHAHNTVEIDRKPHARRNVEPYGSALMDAGEPEPNLFFSEGFVRHGTVEHRRVLIWRPGAWLLVLDRLKDTARHKRHYRQGFQFGPKFEVTPRGELGFTATGGGVSLAVTSLGGPGRPDAPVRGAEHPRLQGWWSPSEGEFQPIWSAGFEAEGSGAVRFSTLFTLNPSAEPLESELDPDDVTGLYRWRMRDKTARIEVRRRDGRLSIRRLRRADERGRTT